MLPLAYNSNLHPAETCNDIASTIRSFSSEVRQGLGWDTLGIDLRLGSVAIDEFRQNPDVATSIREACAAAQVIPYTINAFPLSHFQAAVVKDQAYHPDWTSTQRLDDTITCIDFALALSDEQMISISTLPGTCKLWQPGTTERQQIAAAIGTWAAHAHRRMQETNRQVVLCLEPEPFCLLENSHEIADFWQHELTTYGLGACATMLDNDRSAAAKAMAEHVACCFDTCHVSVGFEDQQECARRMAAAGAPPTKVQFSAAPSCLNPGQNQAGLDSLAAMAEERFLHQCAAIGHDGTLHQVPDLDQLGELLAGCPDATEVRSHFHIPVDKHPQAAGLTSTVADSLLGLQAALNHGARHIAVETYTWSIITDDEQARLHGTIDELAWLADQLQQLEG